jgi:hypothetical protein
MKRVVGVVLAAGMVVGSAAFGEDLTLKPTKDARILGHEQERDQNGGQSTRLRAVGIARDSAEFPIMDFDHAAVKAYLDQNKDKKFKAKLVLPLREVQGLPETPVKLEVATLDSAVDWNEGQGNQKKAEKGECCALAAQFGEKKWTTVSGKEVEQFKDLVWDGEKVTTVLNGKGVDIGKDDGTKTVEIELDDVVLKHLATNPNCRGLFLFHRDKGARIDIFSREQAQKCATLVVTAE